MKKPVSKAIRSSRKSSRKPRALKAFLPLFIIGLLVLPVTIFVSMQNQNLFSLAANASYTAGVTSIGSTMDSGNNNGISATQVTSGLVPGVLGSVSIYIGKVKAAPSNHMQIAVYADNGSNAPGSFVASSNPQVLQSNAWNTFTMTSSPITAGTKYWLAFNVDGSTTQYALAKNSQAHSAWKIPTTYGTWPNPFGTPSEAIAQQQYSIYMTYAANPTPTPLPTATLIPTPTSVVIPTPTATQLTPVPTSTTSRDPLKQPFASTSIWNMPIGSGAVYVAANLPANPGTDLWTPMPQIDDEHIVLQPTAPLVAINYSSAGWSGKSRCSATGGLLVSVPVPSTYVVPSDNTNSAAAFLTVDGRTIVQTQPFTRCTAGGSATSIIQFPNVDLYGDGILGAHGGSDLSAIGGSLRVGELRPGGQGPKHALKLNVDSEKILYPCTVITDCYRWPASVADSGAVGDYGSQNSSPNVALKMGSLLAIPATVDINSLGLQSDPGKQMAWTLQNYGIYIVDSTGGPSYALSAENGPDGSMRTQFQADYGYPLEERINDNTAWSHDFQLLMTKLAVVNNNTASSIGGGGTPLQPLAPPIAP